MKIIKTKNVREEERKGGIFKDQARVREWVGSHVGAEELRAILVTFPAGNRTKLHFHDCEQILVVTDGKGVVATEKERRTITPGTVVLVPKGEKHWHGAARNSSMSHISITSVNSKHTLLE